MRASSVIVSCNGVYNSIHGMCCQLQSMPSRKTTHRRSTPRRFRLAKSPGSESAERTCAPQLAMPLPHWDTYISNPSTPILIKLSPLGYISFILQLSTWTKCKHSFLFSKMTDFTQTFRRTTYPKIAPSANLHTDKTVLVTGSSEGIGYNIAAAFAEAQASTVILVSRNQAKLDIAVADLAKRFPNTKILARACDISSIDRVQNLWPSLAQANIGFVDVLVLNAGATDQPATTEETISSLQFAIGSNVVLTESFRAQPNFDGRHRCLINISSAGFLCYPGISMSADNLIDSDCRTNTRP